MKKFLFCILPFIVIWGGYISLIFVPQLKYEYLGTLNSSIVEHKVEMQSGNDFYILYEYIFTYKDKNGIIRNSQDIHPNESVRYLASRGFSTRNPNNWITQQLFQHGKVYAPGKHWVWLLVIIVMSIGFPLYFICISLRHTDCIVEGKNYSCGRTSDCFGCPFCVTDLQTNNIQGFFISFFKKAKSFFGY